MTAVTLSGSTMAPPDGPVAYLSVRRLSKRFGATQALRDVNLDLHAGRVHALLGANGSGKSTFVKILAGYHDPDSGRVLAHGEPREFRDLSGGQIGFVHQDLGLVQSLSVAENVALTEGFRSTRGWIRWREEYAHVREQLAAFGVEVDPRTPIGEMGPTDQTMIAIARAFHRLPERGGVLVLDEPTARLPITEAHRLLEAIDGIRRRGTAVLYISHRLEEVVQLADELTVLKDGELVHHGLVKGLGRAALAELVVGVSDAESHVHPKATTSPATPIALRVEHLSGIRVSDVSFRVNAGEVVGIAGIVGSGRSELGRLIFGLQPVRAGTIYVAGREIDTPGPVDMVRRGVAYVPQDRHGLFSGMTVRDNSILADLESVSSRLGISTRRSELAARHTVSEMQVKTDGTDAVIDTLSGGNQQKISLGKWLRRPALSVLILDEPTGGIDIGARTEILTLLRRQATDRSLGVLVLDSDIEVLAEHCDRVLVMRSGRLTAEVAGARLNLTALNHAVFGQ